MSTTTNGVEAARVGAERRSRSPRLLIAICALLCVAGGGLGALYWALATPNYMARLVVAPPNEPGEDKSVKLNLDFLGGKGGSQSESYDQFLFQLTGYEVADRLSQQPELVDELLRRKAIRDRQADEMQRFLVRTLEVNRPRLGFLENSTFTELIIKDPDAAFARRLLSNVVGVSDNLVRTRHMAELTASRAEIMQTLPTVTMAEYRESLIRLLSEVERKRIFARVNPAFSFRTIDPLTATSRPVEPKLLLSVGIGFFCGLTVAISLVVLWLTQISVFNPHRG
jgi:hypothetical protein